MSTKKHLMYRLILSLTLLLGIWFQGCQQKNDLRLKKKTFISVLSELMVIEKLAIGEEEKVALVKKVFSDYQVTQEEFLATQEHYKENPDYWMKIYQQAQERIKEKEQAMHPNTKPTEPDLKKNTN